MTPKLSVIVCTCNRHGFLRLALQSLEGQLPATETEILVVNASTYRLPHGFLPPHVRLVEVGNGQQATQGAAMNQGVYHSTGDLLSVVQDDDTVLRGGHLALRTALLSHPEATAVYSLPIYTDVDGVEIDTPPRLRNYLLAHPQVSWPDVEKDGLFIHGTATMYRRSAIERIGGWDPDLHTAEEYDAHLRMLHSGAVFHALDQATVTYRRHQGGKSQIPRRQRRQMRGDVMTRIYARVGLTPSPIAEEPTTR